MEIDILLLTVYFICVGYVIYQMALSVEAQLEDQVALIPDPETLSRSVADQLTNQGLPPGMGEVVAAATEPLKPAMALKLAAYTPRPINAPAESAPATDGQILVQVLPQGPHPLQPVSALTVQVVNQTTSLQVAVDWDRSSFTRMNNQTRRVIRRTPGMRLDLALPQVASVVIPNQFLSTLVTSEDSFSRDPASQVLQISEPLIDTEKMLGLPVPARAYSLNLVIQLMPISGRGARVIVLLLPFRFRLERLTAKAPIPYVDWILKR